MAADFPPSLEDARPPAGAPMGAAFGSWPGRTPPAFVALAPYRAAPCPRGAAPIGPPGRSP